MGDGLVGVGGTEEQPLPYGGPGHLARADNPGDHSGDVENPDEHVLLSKTVPEGYRVITVEEMILENQ